MKTVNMHQAKTHLSELVAKAVQGESFVIAKAGKPMVKVVALDQPKGHQRFGFMKGKMRIPDDIKAFGREEIEEMFYGSK